MATSTTGNGNGGSKAFAAVVSIIAVLGGLAAIVRPMNQTIEQLQTQLAVITERGTIISGNAARLGIMEAQLSEHIALVGHAGVLAEVAASTQRFVEIETQFRALRELVNVYHIETERRLDLVENLTRDYPGRHDERLKQLEKRGSP